MDLAEKITKTVLYPDGHSKKKETAVISEHELMIIVNEQPVYSLVCTKSNLKELVYGRLLTDGVINNAEEVVSVRFCETMNRARVFLNKDIVWQGRITTDLSCCTGNKIFAAPPKSQELKIIPEYRYDKQWVFRLAEEFSKDTKLHGMTGGNHICILAREGKTLFICEDIGRHNTIDKAVGYALLNDIPLNECMIFTSGRVPVDVVEKVVAAGIPVLVSKSVPTFQSVEFAKKYGLNLICRAWPDKCEIY